MTTYTNADRNAAQGMADAINEAQSAGSRVTVNGRQVHSRWTRRSVAQVYSNGTVEVQVRGRKPGTQGYVYVKVGASATVEVQAVEA